MNFALPTAAIILALVPGIAFRNAYLAGKFPRQLAETSPVTELAHYFLFALPFDSVALYALQHEGILQSFETAVRVFTGQFPEASIALVATAFRARWLPVLSSYVILIGIAFSSGNISRRVVWTLRLDVHLRPLRMKHDWYYLLQGRLAGLPRRPMPYADILVEHPGEGSRLYRGLIAGFEITRNGEIRELVLQNAQRGKGRGKEFQWADIPGDAFILFGPAIHSINMRYFYVEPPSNKLERIRWLLRTYARSFLYAEP